MFLITPLSKIMVSNIAIELLLLYKLFNMFILCI